MNFILPVFILGLVMVAVFGFLTARGSGRIGWPRWPARYPSGARRKARKYTREEEEART